LVSAVPEEFDSARGRGSTQVGEFKEYVGEVTEEAGVKAGGGRVFDAGGRILTQVGEFFYVGEFIMGS